MTFDAEPGRFPPGGTSGRRFVRLVPPGGLPLRQLFRCRPRRCGVVCMAARAAARAVEDERHPELRREGQHHRLPPRARPAASLAIRARVAQVVDVALAALDVTVIVFVMNSDGPVPPPAPARRSPPPPRPRPPRPPPRSRPGRPGRGRSPRRTLRGRHRIRDRPGSQSDYRLYTARRALANPPPTRRRHPTAAPDPDQPPTAGPGDPEHPLRRGTRGRGISPCPAALRPRGHCLHHARRPTAHRPPHRPRDVRRHHPPAGRDTRATPRPDAEPDRLDDKPVLDLTAMRALKKSRT